MTVSEPSANWTGLAASSVITGLRTSRWTVAALSSINVSPRRAGDVTGRREAWKAGAGAGIVPAAGWDLVASLSGLATRAPRSVPGQHQRAPGSPIRTLPRRSGSDNGLGDDVAFFGGYLRVGEGAPLFQSIAARIPRCPASSPSSSSSPAPTAPPRPHLRSASSSSTARTTTTGSAPPTRSASPWPPPAASPSPCVRR